ncbi:hypothetical protein KKY_136 [Pelagibacterium halotolerans B2]|uniref:Uncharacterized protein n=1 Tax=Pelagibacterium halotolerans (strain DSM 22347 / JCM 15775 / CGMCC 1.7692 / B2) TaxID=1082931 RepID=G4R729_PELHB|nr:hypothetical protein KKY_136 [Pelagibacterium halotolerans B2]
MEPNFRLRGEIGQSGGYAGQPGSLTGLASHTIPTEFVQF